MDQEKKLDKILEYLEKSTSKVPWYEKLLNNSMIAIIVTILTAWVAFEARVTNMENDNVDYKEEFAKVHSEIVSVREVIEKKASKEEFDKLDMETKKKLDELAKDLAASKITLAQLEIQVRRLALFQMEDTSILRDYLEIEHNLNIASL